MTHFDNQTEFNVGDICVCETEKTYCCGFYHRVIYKVIKKVKVNSLFCYTFEAAFDLFKNTEIAQKEKIESIVKIGVQNFRKLSLVDICLLRTQFDEFINMYVKDMS